MAIKFEKIQAGMTLWRKMTYRNNAGRSVQGWNTVHVNSIDAERRRASVSINGRTEEWLEFRLTRLYKQRPDDRKKGAKS